MGRHVGRKVGLMVFAAALALNAAMLLPIYKDMRTDFISDLQHESTKLFTAAADPRLFPTLDRLVDIGGNLVRTTDIVGGVFVTGIGEEKAEFGKTPSLTWTDARVHGTSWRVADDHSTFEIFLGPETTGTSYGVILRLDAAATWQQSMSRLAKIAMLGPIVAALLGLAALAIMSHQVVRPLRPVARAIDFALNNPAGAQTHLSDVRRRDEIGRLSRALDQLLFFTSTTLVDDLAAALAVTERNPHGILTFSADGHLLSANAAALAMFGARDFDSLLMRDQERLFRFEGKDVSALSMLAGGSAFGHGEIVLSRGTTPCLVGGDVVRRPDGSPLRLFLIFVDVGTMVEDMRNVVRQRQQSQKAHAALEEQLARLRSQFEACLVLLELDRGDAKRVNPVTVTPNLLVEAWRAKATKRGRLGEGGIAHGEIPPVTGDPDEVRRLFDAAFEVICHRNTTPKLSIELAGVVDDDGMVTITIWANSPDEATGRFATVSAEAEVSLLLSAISILARRQGGRLVASVLNEDGNALAFSLPADQKTTELSARSGREAHAA